MLAYITTACSKPERGLECAGFQRLLCLQNVVEMLVKVNPSPGIVPSERLRSFSKTYQSLSGTSKIYI
jgi:hypothetical protein